MRQGSPHRHAAFPMPLLYHKQLSRSLLYQLCSTDSGKSVHLTQRFNFVSSSFYKFKITKQYTQTSNKCRVSKKCSLHEYD